MSQLASSVNFHHEDRVLRKIPVGAILTLAMQGITERGPLHEAPLVFDFPDFQRVYGGFTSNGNVAMCAQAFFLNGGTRLRVNRIVHYSDVTDPTTKTSAKATVTLQNDTPVNTLKCDAKYDGAWGNSLKIKIEAATSAEAAEFNLTVLLNDVPVEKWANLSMVDTDARYVETIINDADTGSNYIAVTDLDAPGNQRPANATSSAMSGGDDGLGSLADADFNGGSGANGKTGLRVFDKYRDIDVLCSPDRCTSSHHNAMVTYCDVVREGTVFAVLDPPALQTAAQMATYVKSTASLVGLSENAAIYWPRVKVLNPNKSVFGSGRLITVPPSGHVCGVYARVDASKIGGMFEQPAGLDPKFLPRGIEALETDEVKDISKRELLFPLNVNLISQEEGTPIFIDGARNLDITGNWPSVGEARGVMFIVKRLKPALGFLRHRNLKPRLYNEGEMTAKAFLESLKNEEAFAGYSVDFSAALNPPSVQSQRRVKARIGIDMWGVGEFIDVFVGPDSDDLASQLA